MTNIVPAGSDPKRVLALYVAVIWLLTGLLLTAGCLPTHDHNPNAQVAPITTRQWY